MKGIVVSRLLIGTKCRTGVHEARTGQPEKTMRFDHEA
jgi:hypothetical protein